MFRNRAGRPRNKIDVREVGALRIGMVAHAPLYGQQSGYAGSDIVVVALREMVNSQFSAAAYWPAARSVPQIALLTTDLAQATAPGRVFGELAERYSGYALKTEGDLPAVSAIGDDGTLRIIVPSMSPDPVIVRVKLPNNDWNKIIQSTVLEGTGETNPNGVASENLAVTVNPAY